MTATSVIQETEVLVIGGGPGGYAAAFRAADLGLEVTIVDDSESLGGVCLQRGCIPSKALLHIARLITEAREAAEWGVRFDEPRLDLERIREWKNEVVGGLVGGIDQLCDRRRIRRIKGRAVFIDSDCARIAKADVARVNFRKCVLASGSKPIMPPLFRVDSGRVWDSTDALGLPEIPGRLLVVGGGYIGLELGSVYAALGSRVVIAELTAGLLPGVDRDLVRHVKTRCESQFEAIHLETRVAGLQDTGQGILASFEASGESRVESFDRVLVAIGRAPVTSGLGLENTDVQIGEDGFVVVDEQRRTTDPAIWAIGDVAGQPMLAHKATREAHVAAESMAGAPTAYDPAAMPAVVYTDPELAWCGLSENEAKQRGVEIQVARFPWSASGRARTLGRSDGSTKIIFDPATGRVLGVGIVGPNAGELIGEGVLAVEMAAVARDVAASVHPHPTLSETVMEGAEQFFGSSTHLYRPPRSKR